MPDALLSVRGVEAGYASRQILFGVDLDVFVGEVVALLGANGSGKSTLLNVLSGFVRPRRGSILLDGVELAGLPPHRTFRRGIVQVSQARDLFPEMSVEENRALAPGRSEATPRGCSKASMHRSRGCRNGGDRWCG